jgi:NAD(P)-dependent dehydrogenase (short-subunit alcohol dehydrogenase family)
MQAFQDKVVVVVGASGSIGAATARAFAARGAAVVLAALPDALLDSIERELRERGARVAAVPTDITKRADIDRLVASALATFGRIDVLANVAGIGSGPALRERTDDELHDVIAINLIGPARVMHAVLPVMKAQGSGAIVNIGSIAGEVGIMGIYSASKFGLRGLSDSVRREVHADNISVTLIEPGFVRSAMNPAHGDRLPGPEIVADAIVDAVMHPRRARIVPWWYRIPVFFVTTFPWLTDLVFRDPRIQERLNRDARLQSRRCQEPSS